MKTLMASNSNRGISITIHYEPGIVESTSPEVLAYIVRRDMASLSMPVPSSDHISKLIDGSNSVHVENLSGEKEVSLEPMHQDQMSTTILGCPPVSDALNVLLGLHGRSHTPQ
jgi:hypothetical protein